MASNPAGKGKRATTISISDEIYAAIERRRIDLGYKSVAAYANAIIQAWYDKGQQPVNRADQALRLMDSADQHLEVISIPVTGEIAAGTVKGSTRGPE